MKISRRDGIFYGVVGAVILGFCITALIVQKAYLWLDETEFTLQYMWRVNFFVMLWWLIESVYSMPIYYIVMWPWVNIVGIYNMPLLLLPGVIATGVGVFFVALTARKLAGDVCGIIAAVFCVFQSVFMRQCALEIRPYAFLFMFSAIVLYLMIIRHEKRTRANGIALGIAVTCFIFSHWVATFMVVVYGIFEVTRVLRTKRKATESILTPLADAVRPYMVAGAMLVVWTVTCYLVGLATFGSYWTKPVTWDTILRPFWAVFDVIVYRDTYRWTYQWQNILFGTLFVAGLVVVCLWHDARTRFVATTMLAAILLVLVTSLVYISFWYERYFVFLLPHAYILCALAVSQLPLPKFNRKNILGFGYRAVPWVAVVVTFCIVAIKNIDITHEYVERPHEAESSYHLAHFLKYNMPSAIDNPNVLIVWRATPYMADYYLDMLGIKLGATGLVYYIHQTDIMPASKIYKTASPLEWFYTSSFERMNMPPVYSNYDVLIIADYWWELQSEYDGFERTSGNRLRNINVYTKV